MPYSALDVPGQVDPYSASFAGTPFKPSGGEQLLALLAALSRNNPDVYHGLTNFNAGLGQRRMSDLASMGSYGFEQGGGGLPLVRHRRGPFGLFGQTQPEQMTLDERAAFEAGQMRRQLMMGALEAQKSQRQTALLKALVDVRQSAGPEAAQQLAERYGMADMAASFLKKTPQEEQSEKLYNARMAQIKADVSLRQSEFDFRTKFMNFQRNIAALRYKQYRDMLHSKKVDFEKSKKETDRMFDDLLKTTQGLRSQYTKEISSALDPTEPRIAAMQQRLDQLMLLESQIAGQRATGQKIGGQMYKDQLLKIMEGEQGMSGAEGGDVLSDQDKALMGGLE